MSSSCVGMIHFYLLQMRLGVELNQSSVFIWHLNESRISLLVILHLLIPPDWIPSSLSLSPPSRPPLCPSIKRNLPLYVGPHPSTQPSVVAHPSSLQMAIAQPSLAIVPPQPERNQTPSTNRRHRWPGNTNTYDTDILNWVFSYQEKINKWGVLVIRSSWSS